MTSVGLKVLIWNTAQSNWRAVERIKMNELQYRTKRITIDAETLKLLKTMESRRRVVNAHVNRLHKVLLEGKNFDAPMVVNELDVGKFRLLDGNHRLEAIKKWIADDKENKRKLEVSFAIYDKLDAEEEREVFTKWNSGRRQSSNDFIQLYASEIPILQKMLKSFPVSVRIYSLQEGQRGIHFSSIMKAYFMAEAPYPQFKPYTGAAKRFVDDCIALGDDDYDKLKDFVKFFESTFGILEKDNPYQTTTSLNCFTTIYMDNEADFGIDELSRLFKRHVLGKSQVLILGSAGGRVATENLYNELRALFSKGRSKNALRFRQISQQEQTSEIPANSEDLPSI
jgi:hypothetical protein